MILSASKQLQMTAWFLGTRLSVRSLDGLGPVGDTPSTLSVGARGHAMLFRFGVVVFLDTTATEQASFIESIKQQVPGAFDNPETESIEIVIDPEKNERMDSANRLILHELSLERVQVVAHVLAKSTVLAHYEETVATVFEQVERMAETLRLGGRGSIASRALVRQVADVLLIQTRTVGRVEITEKPEITWDHPELDRLYERLALEYELQDRDIALTRKLDLIARTAETYHDLLQNRQMLRVEWYIVILILVEIVLSVFDIFFPR